MSKPSASPATPPHAPAPQTAVDRLLAALGTVLTHRWLVLLINLLIIYIMVGSFIHYLNYFDGAPEHTHDLCEGIVGIGVVMIGWGVALEERYSLRHIFRMPDIDNVKECALDDLCHYYGVGLLIMGLFSEILVEFVRLPNEILNTDGIDGVVLGVSDAMLVLCLIMLVTFSWSLIVGVKVKSDKA